MDCVRAVSAANDKLQWIFQVAGFIMPQLPEWMELTLKPLTTTKSLIKVLVQVSLLCKQEVSCSLFY